MALTTLDRQTALILIDLQQGVLAIPRAHSIDEVVKHCCSLVDAFRRYRLPVVLVNVDGVAPGRTEQAGYSGQFPPGWTDLIPELKPLATDHRVTKQTWGAFTNTDLRHYLTTLEVTQVVVAGVATSIGVESTTRQAHELGFNVTFAIDAMTDSSLDAHTNSVMRIFPRLGETGETRAIIELLGAKRA